MDRSNSVEITNIKLDKELNGFTKNYSSYAASLKNILKKSIVFICYGPGVFGFLWLIGRILKR